MKRLKSLPIGFVIVCYANHEMVRNTVEAARKLGIPLFLVDNHSPDPLTRAYLKDLSKVKSIKVLDPGKNIGCHQGFTFGFDYILGHYKHVDLLVKCDDDTCPPPQWDADLLLAMFRTYDNLAFVGSNFFSDGRLMVKDVVKYTFEAVEKDLLELGTEVTKVLRKYEVNFIGWSDIINIPWGVIRTEFYFKIGGLRTDYYNADGPVTDQDHLYGGEEAYMCKKAQELGYSYGYLFDWHAIVEHNDLLDPDYILWKYMYGYLGKVKCDFAEFKKNKDMLDDGYNYWLENSENGLHKEWAEKHFARWSPS